MKNAFLSVDELRRQRDDELENRVNDLGKTFGAVPLELANFQQVAADRASKADQEKHSRTLADNADARAAMAESRAADDQNMQRTKFDQAQSDQQLAKFAEGEIDRTLPVPDTVVPPQLVPAADPIEGGLGPSRPAYTTPGSRTSNPNRPQTDDEILAAAAENPKLGAQDDSSVRAALGKARDDKEMHDAKILAQKAMVDKVQAAKHLADLKASGQISLEKYRDAMVALGWANHNEGVRHHEKAEDLTATGLDQGQQRIDETITHNGAIETQGDRKIDAAIAHTKVAEGQADKKIENQGKQIENKRHLSDQTNKTLIKIETQKKRISTLRGAVDSAPNGDFGYGAAAVNWVRDLFHNPSLDVSARREKTSLLANQVVHDYAGSAQTKEEFLRAMQGLGNITDPAIYKQRFLAALNILDADYNTQYDAVKKVVDLSPSTAGLVPGLPGSEVAPPPAIGKSGDASQLTRVFRKGTNRKVYLDVSPAEADEKRSKGNWE